VHVVVIDAGSARPPRMGAGEDDGEGGRGLGRNRPIGRNHCGRHGTLIRIAGEVRRGPPGHDEPVHRQVSGPDARAGGYPQGATEHGIGLGSKPPCTAAVRVGESRGSVLGGLGAAPRATRVRT
jgi:hypothetical protein